MASRFPTVEAWVPVEAEVAVRTEAALAWTVVASMGVADPAEAGREAASATDHRWAAEAAA
jgi:hypothetical protein